MEQYIVKYGGKDFYISSLPPSNDVVWYLEPKELEPIGDVGKEVRRCLLNPIGTRPLSELTFPGQEIVILVDDISRPTPQHQILPEILDVLNETGISDKQISIIIALGTHRPMQDGEIVKKYGMEVYKRVKIINNPWDNPERYIFVGKTSSEIPVYMLKDVVEADLVIGVGNIGPHIHAGWSGGAKIIQPGICNWETTGFTHLIAPRDPSMFDLAGTIDTRFRGEIEEIAEMVKFKFIVNTVIGKDNAVIGVFAGDPICAHRAGVKKAYEALVRPIHCLADIVVVSAYPGEIDYWQGAKAAYLAQKALKEGEVTVLVGAFPEGICKVHNAFEQYALESVEEIERLMDVGVLKDRVCGGALLQHARLLKRTHVICYSEGLSRQQTESLGFEYATSIASAMERALILTNKNAQIGIINYGWMVIPELFLV